MPDKYHIHWVVLAAWFAVAAGVFLPISESRAQMSEAEHLSHHPDQAAAAAAVSTAPGPGTTGMETPGGMDSPAGTEPPSGAGGMKGGGMGGMMEKMFKVMAAPSPKEEYPTLMTLPNLSAERQREVSHQASERMASGMARLSDAVDRLSKATLDGDYETMQQATARMREGLAQFESGLAAQRVIAEGQPPHQVALQWFKSEMNLQPPQGVETRSGLWDGTSFHLFGMVLLIAFTLAMFVLYFFKMRRAAALFGRIEASKEAPPPGSKPELAGAAPPPATGADKPATDVKGSSA
jgi:hypothetical protein